MANFQVLTRNCDVNSRLRDHCEEKLLNLGRFWPRVDDAIVRFSQERGTISAEVTLISGGMITRAEERADDMRQAFDFAVDKVERQLNRYKKKTQTQQRRQNNRDDVAGTIIHPVDPVVALNNGVELPGPALSNGNGAAQAEDNGEDEQEMVRVKRFALKPMSPEEAALQMDLLGHEFFVFRDAASNEVSVVYRRRSGGYGLIEPVAD
jgi:putative sigma-54 modulation protein